MKILLSFFIFSFFSISNAQMVKSPTDPAKAQFVYTDIENFIIAHKQLKPGSDSSAILQKHYIDKGTPGLKIFIEKYGLPAERLKNAIAKYPEDYHALGKKMAWLKTQEDSLYRYFKKFAHFIPGAIFPPTYFLVDRRRGIGSGSIEGQLITIEKEAKRIIDPGIKTHIVHELVHLNQLNAIGSLEKYLAIYREKKSLLAITLREGIAEFFAELITGKYTQDEAAFYVNAYEPELWKKFQKEMRGRETGDWMWRQPGDSNQPRDAGYVFGAKIAEYYYKNHPDLQVAVSELLGLTDYKAFLKRCGYERKFLMSKSK